MSPENARPCRDGWRGDHPFAGVGLQEESTVSGDCKTIKRWLERGSSVWRDCDVEEEGSVSGDCKTIYMWLKRRSSICRSVM